MSIMIIIQDPETEEEKAFSIPLASEKFFTDVWEPLAEELELQWVPTFLSGVDVRNEDLHDILSEIKQLEDLGKKKLSPDEIIQLCGRVNLLREKLPHAFNRAEAIVFIG